MHYYYYYYCCCWVTLVPAVTRLIKTYKTRFAAAVYRCWRQKYERLSNCISCLQPDQMNDFMSNSEKDDHRLLLKALINIILLITMRQSLDSNFTRFTYHNIQGLGRIILFYPMIQRRRQLSAKYVNTASSQSYVKREYHGLCQWRKNRNMHYENVCGGVLYLDFELIRPVANSRGDDWCLTATFVQMASWMGRATSIGNEAKSKMKHPSDIPTPRFDLRWYWSLVQRATN